MLSYSHISVERDHRSPGQEQQERLKGIEETAWGAQRREDGGHWGTQIREAEHTHAGGICGNFFLTLSLQDGGGGEEGKK